VSKVVIFGGAGFIGSVLAEKLASSENQILILDKFIHGDVTHRLQNLREMNNVKIKEFDIVHTNDLVNIFSEFKPNQIFHLAANSDIRPSDKLGSRDFKDTLGTTVSIAEALKKHPVDKFVFASTSAIFGSVDKPISSNHHVLNPLNPISEYGVAKLSSEYVLQACCNNKLIQQLSIVRFPNVVGRNATHGIIFDFVQSFLRNDPVLKVLGNGSQQKPFLLVDELVQALLNIMSLELTEPYVVNLSPSDTCTVKDIVEIFLEISKWDAIVEFGSTPEGWKGDVPNYSYEENIWTQQFRPSKEAVRSAIISVLNQYKIREI